MFMIFLGAFYAVAVGDPFPGRFRFPNTESNRLNVYEEKVYNDNPLVNTASFHQPTPKHWKRTYEQPNVVLKAAPDALKNRDYEHAFTRKQMNTDNIWTTTNHKKILAPGFRTPPKIPVIGLPVNIPVSTPSMSKKEFLKAERLRKKQERHKKFQQKPSVHLKRAPLNLAPQKVEPKMISTQFQIDQPPATSSKLLRQPTKMMNIPPLSKLKKVLTPKFNPFTAYNSTTIVSENAHPKAHLKHGNPDQIWHDGETSEFDGVLHELQHMANPDKKYVNKFKPKRVQQQKWASRTTSTTKLPQTLATTASTTSNTPNRIFSDAATTSTEEPSTTHINTPPEEPQYFEEDDSAFRTKIPFNGQNALKNLEKSYKDPFSSRFEQLQEILEERKRQEKEEELRKTVQSYMRNGETSPYSMILDKYRKNEFGVSNSRYDNGNSFTDNVKARLKSRYGQTTSAVESIDTFMNDYDKTPEIEADNYESLGNLLPTRPISYMGALPSDLCGSDKKCLSNQLRLAADQLDPSSENYVEPTDLEILDEMDISEFEDLNPDDPNFEVQVKLKLADHKRSKSSDDRHLFDRQIQRDFVRSVGNALHHNGLQKEDLTDDMIATINLVSLPLAEQRKLIRQKKASDNTCPTRSSGTCSTPFNLDSIWGYGCWCNFGEDLTEGASRPANMIDNVCKNYQLCLRCARFDNKRSGCNPEDIDFAHTTKANFVYGCSSENQGDECATHVCTCHGQFMADLVSLVFNEEFWAAGGYDAKFKHDNGFDFRGSCVAENHHGSNGPMQCCGNYPFRYPYGSGKKKCCADKTIYNPKRHHCCEDTGIVVKGAKTCPMP